MSVYTTELRYICEQYAGLEHSAGYKKVKEIIEKSREKVFDFDYPIFDIDYKPVLETKILRHFYGMEICAETVGLWKLWLEDKLNIIMPYYNQLYKSELIEFNPMYDIDITTEHKGTGSKDGSETNNTENNSAVTSQTTTNDTTENSGTSTNTTTNSGETNNTETRDLTTATTGTTNVTGSGSNSETTTENSAIVTTDTTENNTTKTNTHYDMYSDTPQGALDGVENNKYLTNARKTTDNEKDTVKTIDNNNVEKAGTITKKGENNQTNNTTISNTVKDTGTIKNAGTNSNTETTSTSDSLNITTNGSVNNTVTNSGTGTATRTTNFSTLDNYIQTVRGKNGGASYSSLLSQFRDTFLNIDKMILDELEVLFMQIY